MPQWSEEQHLAYMTAAGVDFAPRYGAGVLGDPWRDADGTEPRRDPRREHARFQQYMHALPGAYAAMLERLNRNLPPLDPDCRLCVLLPCRNEAQHIETILSMLATQYDSRGRPLPRDRYEVIVLVNNMPGERTDDTAARARAWRHPLGMTRHVVDYLHPDDEPYPLTMSRKVLADLAMIRAAQRGPASHPLFLASEDADLLWMDPRQLSMMIDALDADPGLDGLRGQQDRCPWIMIRHPLLFLMRRSWNFCEAMMARKALRPEHNPSYDFNWNRIVASGWNTVFSGEVYAQIGGYTRERRFGEDMDIGEKISCLRATETPAGLLPQVNTFARLTSRSEGSPRRWFYRISADIEPYLDDDDYENFFGLGHEAAVKFQSIESFDAALQPHTALRPENIPFLTSMMQADLDFLVAARGAEGESDYRRILRWSGFGTGDCSVADGRLEIADIGLVAQCLDGYAKRWRDSPIAPARQARAVYRRSWHGPARVRQEPPFRIGLIGCGRIVEEGHASAYVALPDTVEIAALFDPEPDRCARLAALLGVPREACHDALESVTDGTDLDLVVIASPTAFHAAAVEHCLTRGISVICEKPIALDAAEARRLRTLAEERGLTLATVHNYLGSELWRRGLDRVHSGALGKPRALRTRMASDGALPGLTPHRALWRHDKSLAGRGCLLDQGYHLFYVSQSLFGSPISSVDCAVSVSARDGRDVEDFAEVTLHHACGGQTAFTIDWCNDTVEPTVYAIDCEAATIHLDEDRNRLEIRSADGAVEVEALGDAHDQGYPASLGESLMRMAAGAAPLTPAEDGIDVLDWIDAAYRRAGA